MLHRKRRDVLAAGPAARGLASAEIARYRLLCTVARDRSSVREASAAHRLAVAADADHALLEGLIEEACAPGEKGLA